MSQLVTGPQAAELAGVAPSTWRTYVARWRGTGLIPEPVEYHGRTAMYDENAVRTWAANRLGRGRRTDLATQ